jgi:DNA-binding response OmpR family regulator
MNVGSDALPSYSPGRVKLKRFNFSKASVVIVDRSVLSLKVLSGMLAGFGFRKVHRFETLREGIEHVKSGPVDLIFLDPDSYGSEAYDFVRWIRSERTGEIAMCPVIMVSGYTPIRQVTASRQCGADFVIAKPFSTTVMLERILWVAANEGRRGGLTAPETLVSANGSGVELW